MADRKQVAKAGGARGLVWQLHQQVWRDGAYANLAWPRLLGASELSGEDRKFATELAYGSLRRFGQWREIVAAASARDPQRLEPGVLWLLVMGTHQLLAMSTPPHAAVNETVALSHQVGVGRASGLVNAVLRRVSQRTLDQWIDVITEGIPDHNQRLGLTHAHPLWVVEAFATALEREGAIAELEDLLVADNTPARTSLVLLDESPGDHDDATPYSPRGVYLEGDPGVDPRVVSGMARIQDEGSQLAALIASHAAPLSGSSRILDACAGPGGKTAVIASIASAVGASVVAVEQHAHRASLVSDAVSHLAAQSVTVVIADVREYLASAGLWDLIVLDAPCSGLGALRRRPEARWRKQPEDIAELVDIQRSLLASSAEALAEGGHLVYITCSPVVAETTEVISWLLATRDDLVALDTGAILQTVVSTPMTGVSVGTAVQLWPHRHHTDAMFIQVLHKHSPS